MHFHFLVVEDEPAVALAHRILLERVLDDSDLLRLYTPKMVSTEILSMTSEAEAALEQYFATEAFHEPQQVVICLMDQRMPREYGTTFINRVRLRYARYHLGALLLSAYGEDSEVQNTRDHGITAFSRSL